MDQVAGDIGSRLQQARERRGLTLQDVANTTRISTAALRAIERNDFARLPGGVFRRAYVRAFAAEVGLDADELTREYRARFEPEAPAGPPPPRRSDWPESFRLVYRVATVLVPVGGILIGASVMAKCGQGPDVTSRERSAPQTVEAGLVADTAPTASPDAAAEEEDDGGRAVGEQTPATARSTGRPARPRPAPR